MEISKQINDLIEKYRCTAKELANASDLSVSVISRYRNGTRRPSKQQLQKLAKGFEIIAKQHGEEFDLSDMDISDENSDMDMFVRKVDCLFSNELPNANHYDVGEYISFLDYQYDGDVETFKELFRRSNLYIWLTNVLRKNENNMFFGGLSKELHSVLIADPKPYRKDVKIYLANIFSLSTLALEMAFIA